MHKLANSQVLAHCATSLSVKLDTTSSGLQEQHYKKQILTQPRSMGLLGVARANTAVGVSPETFLLLLHSLDAVHTGKDSNKEVHRSKKRETWARCTSSIDHCNDMGSRTREQCNHIHAPPLGEES
jgi:hypothetical protein